MFAVKQFILQILSIFVPTINVIGAPLLISSDEKNFRIPLNQFEVEIEWYQEESVPLYITISQDSLTWKKFDSGNRLPQLILSIHIDDPSNIHLTYKENSYIPEIKDQKHIFLTVDVFSNDKVNILKDGRKLGYITVSPNPNYFKHRYVYVDHSCSPFNINLGQTKDLFTSISCHFYPNKKRKGILDISLLPAESRLSDNSNPPYTVQLTGDAKSEARLKKDDEKFIFEIKANVPKYIPQLKIALGYGPYFLKAIDEEKKSKNHLTAAYMIYGKYDLSSTTSIRFFNALLNSGTLFNNLGSYFAYEVGSTKNRRLSIVPLLGFQGISFRKNKDDSIFTHVIFPQGGELVYRHAFGFRNYHLIYGMFVSTIENVGYENIWLRFGKKIFWEINLINWNFEGRQTRMWGLSVGVPFLSI